MGVFFTSFDDAWRHFLARREPLEDFFAHQPEEEATLAAWLITPPDELKQAAAQLQDDLAHVAGIEWTPQHFLHVWLTPLALDPTDEQVSALTGAAREAWAEVDPFEIQYRRLNCFHDAVVVEVEGDGPRVLLELTGDAEPTFLPHMTLGYFRGENDPAQLRDAVVPLRDAGLGLQRVTELQLCLAPFDRHRIVTTPWTVADTVRLGTGS